MTVNLELSRDEVELVINALRARSQWYAASYHTDPPADLVELEAKIQLLSAAIPVEGAPEEPVVATAALVVAKKTIKKASGA